MKTARMTENRIRMTLKDVKNLTRLQAVLACLIIAGLCPNLLRAETPPEFQWVTQAGGPGNDKGTGITVDKQGNSYVCGQFCLYVAGVDCDPVTFFGNTVWNTQNGQCYVAKFNSAGELVWVKQMVPLPLAVAVDEAGNCYITGATAPNAHLVPVFVAKLDSEGNQLWFKIVGKWGGDSPKARAIAVDSTGNCYVTGDFGGTLILDSITLSGNGMFVAKFDTANGNVLWASKAGDSYGEAWGHGIAVDGANNCYVAGQFNGTTTFGDLYGTISLTSTEWNNNYWDGFVVKYNADGHVVWASQIKRASGDFKNRIPLAVAVDQAGNGYVSGWFTGTAKFGTNSLTSRGLIDVFLARFDSSGNPQWLVGAGGMENEGGGSVALDAGGNCYWTAQFVNQAFVGTNILTSLGQHDIFVAKYSPSGNLAWFKQAGGSGDDCAYITADTNGTCFLTGWFENTATFGQMDVTSLGYADIFVAKLMQPPTGDFNKDGCVNFLDYAALALHWPDVNCGDPDWCNGVDIDRDGSVNLSELKIFAAHWLEEI